MGIIKVGTATEVGVFAGGTAEVGVASSSEDPHARIASSPMATPAPRSLFVNNATLTISSSKIQLVCDLGLLGTKIYPTKA